MPVLDRIAFFQGRRDEVTNQELARELVARRDAEGIREIAQNLENKNPNVQSDCIKVLYEIGYLDPGLVAEYVGAFLKLLRSHHNRLVWGTLLALSTTAALRADEVYAHRDELVKLMNEGSVIASDNAVKTLAAVASHSDEYRAQLMPHLVQHLETCRPKDVPQHAESTLVAVDASSKGAFVDVLARRLPQLSSSQATHVRKVVKAAEAR